MLTIRYNLTGDGWGIVEFDDGAEVVRGQVSYLNDPLAELARMAVDAIDEDDEFELYCDATFFDEPGVCV